jgi:hypothetical protein
MTFIAARLRFELLRKDANEFRLNSDTTQHHVGMGKPRPRLAITSRSADAACAESLVRPVSYVAHLTENTGDTVSRPS